MDKDIAKTNKKALLKLLQDPEIVQRIQQIVQETSAEMTVLTALPSAEEAQIKQQQNQITELETELKEKDSMIKELKASLQKMTGFFKQEEQEKQALQKDLNQAKQQTQTLQTKFTENQTQIQNLEKQVQQLQDQLKPMQPLLEAYAGYQQLSSSTHKSLQGIFYEESFTVFIAAGLQQKNIEALHDYLKNEIMENHNPDQVFLITLFNHLLSLFVQGIPKYVIDMPTGQTFNPVQHIKTPSSAPAGNIKKVVLPGWKLQNNQKIIKQAIVHL